MIIAYRDRKQVRQTSGAAVQARGPKSPAPVRRAAAVLTTCVGLQLCGCHNDSSAPTPSPVKTPSPQERFDRIVDTVKELLEGGISSRDPRGSVSGTYTVEASPRISDADREDAPLRGFIKVTLKTKYFASRAEQEEAEPKEPQREDRSEQRSSFAEENELLDQPQAEIFDEGLIPEVPRGGRGDLGIKPMVPTVRTTEADTQTVYYLEFIRGRWRLAAPPQDGGMPSMNEAVNIALKRQ